MAAAREFAIDIGGKFLDGLTTFIDIGYKAYDFTIGALGDMDEDKFSNTFNGLIDSISFAIDAIIIGTLISGKGGIGQLFKRKPPKTTPKPKLKKLPPVKPKGVGVAPIDKPSKPVPVAAPKPVKKPAPKPAPVPAPKPAPAKIFSRKPVRSPSVLTPKQAKSTLRAIARSFSRTLTETPLGAGVGASGASGTGIPSTSTNTISGH